jgi:ABC-type transport system involved in multi-copper enzyme maturation permease subunit
MSATPVLMRKEFRALIGAWLTIAAGMMVGELPGLHDFRELGVVGYAAGAAALGALSIGHEYRYGTLSQLLAQPVSRMRLLSIKIAVLALLLAGLAAVAVLFPLANTRWPVRGLRTMAVLPLLYGICVAPWITLKTRNVLAGTMFSGSIGSLLFIGSYFWATGRYASEQEITASRLAFVWAGSAIACTGGALALWTTFLGLEVSDGARADLELPAALRSGSASSDRRTARHPVLLLVAKELHLQQLTFAASLLYAVGYVGAVLVDASYVARFDVLLAITAIHGLAVAAMTGSLSCAEERVIGTHQWQLLQPMSTRAQFAIKVGVVLSLTLILALGLPAVLSTLPSGASEHWAHGQRLAATSGLVAIASVSMYISSLAGSGLTALLLCIPAFLGTSIFRAFIVSPLVGNLVMYLHLPPQHLNRATYRALDRAEVLVACAFVAFVLWLAFENHRESGRSLRHVVAQLGLMAAIGTLVSAAFGVARLL